MPRIRIRVEMIERERAPALRERTQVGARIIVAESLGYKANNDTTMLTTFNDDIEDKRFFLAAGARFFLVFFVFFLGGRFSASGGRPHRRKISDLVVLDVIIEVNWIHCILINID